MPRSPASAPPGIRSEAANLVAALAAPDPEPVLEAALARLAAGADLGMLFATAVALTRIGVPGLAGRLLAATGPGVRDREDVQAVLAEISKLPGGGVDLDSPALTARRAANCAAIKNRYGTKGPRLDNCRHTLSVFTTRTGNQHVVQGSAESWRGEAGVPLGFVFPFTDQRRGVQRLDLGTVNEGASFLLLGVPSVPLLQRLLELRTDSGYRPPIEIIETDAAIFDVWLHLIEDADSFDPDRLGLHVGADALEHYAAERVRRHWRGEATHTLTNRRVNWTPPPIDAAWRANVRSAVERRRTELLDRQRARVDARDTPRLAQLDSGSPLRVLGLTTRFSTVIRHAMRDLAGAFERHAHTGQTGHTFDLHMEPTDSDCDVDTWSILAETDYDLVVVINHLRAELQGRVDARLPFVSWIQDHLAYLWTPQAGASVTPRDLVIGRDPWTMSHSFGYPAERFLPAVNVTDARTYDDAPVDEAMRAKLACDVSFVSHASQTPAAMIDAMGADADFTAYLREVAARLERRLENHGWVPFIELLHCMDEAEGSSAIEMTPHQRRHRAYPIVASLFDRIVRHQALAWTANWARSRGRTLRIYGRGWPQHPSLAPYAAGEIDNGLNLRALYQASAVSLQVNAHGSHHQRLLDGIASGGFVLSRANPFDLRRPPTVALRDAIEEHGMKDLLDLAAWTRRDADLHRARTRLDELHGVCLEPRGSARREREARLLTRMFAMSEAELSDEAVFASCLRPLPYRLAGDLDGFEETIFGDEPALHAMLDRFVDDGEARAAITRRMRADILAHDTYDALVPRIIEAFGDAGREGPRKEHAPCSG